MTLVRCAFSGEVIHITPAARDYLPGERPEMALPRGQVPACASAKEVKAKTAEKAGVPGPVPAAKVARSTDQFASAPLQKQKQMIGERMFPLIQRMYPDQAGKITGMLLELDNTELLHMLKDQTLLKGKAEVAMAVLQTPRRTQAPIRIRTIVNCGP